MTYNVFGGTLSLTQAINQSVISDYWQLCHIEMIHHRRSGLTEFLLAGNIDKKVVKILKFIVS